MNKKIILMFFLCLMPTMALNLDEPVRNVTSQDLQTLTKIVTDGQTYDSERMDYIEQHMLEIKRVEYSIRVEMAAMFFITMGMTLLMNHKMLKKVLSEMRLFFASCVLKKQEIDPIKKEKETGKK